MTTIFRRSLVGLAAVAALSAVPAFAETQLLQAAAAYEDARGSFPMPGRA